MIQTGNNCVLGSMTMTEKCLPEFEPPFCLQFEHQLKWKPQMVLCCPLKPKFAPFAFLLLSLPLPSCQVLVFPKKTFLLLMMLLKLPVSAKAGCTLTAKLQLCASSSSRTNVKCVEPFHLAKKAKPGVNPNLLCANSWECAFVCCYNCGKSLTSQRLELSQSLWQK